ncbi:hypothetical protein [Novosphingobium mangrovi (ex Hu et al. 2023)]|uniref:Uncharacterized protein n=1 Tax=Novosphingobium mangrovi (ex Hu et al. 2023) TaxID=2930094 RepID=A0ABT0AIF6_9SPHN|nr:hypothetical protein [Novosphingobium mangrovi (ex Hu et al. 2023)]MCJ1962981.1 hypothetical protein [Novosphingobium mangrovi (ex Hu et al. 2023)]
MTGLVALMVRMNKAIAPLLMGENRLEGCITVISSPTMKHISTRNAKDIAGLQLHVCADMSG